MSEQDNYERLRTRAIEVAATVTVQGSQTLGPFAARQVMTALERNGIVLRRFGETGATSTTERLDQPRDEALGSSPEALARRLMRAVAWVLDERHGVQRDTGPGERLTAALDGLARATAGTALGAAVLPDDGVERRMWTETAKPPGSLTIGPELMADLSAVLDLDVEHARPSDVAEALVSAAAATRRTETYRRRQVAAANDELVDSAADDADAPFGERTTAERSFPVPVRVEVCGLCGQSWPAHEEQADRRATGPDTPLVEPLDCARVLVEAAQGPPGPPGPQGARGDRGATGARGPAGGGWSGSLP
jgi:hypothetical protein